MLMTGLTILLHAIILLFAIVGYFTLGFFETCTGDGLDIFIRDNYIKYLVKKYPEKYYFEDNRYWRRTSQYTSDSIYEDPKVNKLHDIVSWCLFILWPIDMIYKVIDCIIKICKM